MLVHIAIATRTKDSLPGFSSVGGVHAVGFLDIRKFEYYIELLQKAATVDGTPLLVALGSDDLVAILRNAKVLETTAFDPKYPERNHKVTFKADRGTSRTTVSILITKLSFPRIQ